MFPAARPLPQQGERGQVHGAGSTAHGCLKALTTCLPGARLPGLRCGDGECWRLLEWHRSTSSGIQVGTLNTEEQESLDLHLLSFPELIKM